jgi:hypothetical protein
MLTKIVQVLAHDQVHEAFIQGPIGKGQVFLVSEPEAMFRSWVHSQDDPQHFQVGTSFLGIANLQWVRTLHY